MRLMSSTLGFMLLLVTVPTIAQRAITNPDPVVARLSYQSGRMIDWRNQKGTPQVCMAAYQSGYYQLSRLTESGTQTLEGAMPKEQLGQLKHLLQGVDFRSEAGGVQYLQGAESFVLEVGSREKTEHYFWINPENRNPLPKSAVNIVNWLENFGTRGATPFRLHEAGDIRICPSLNQNPMPLSADASF
jgi:hypothetical protein